MLLEHLPLGVVPDDTGVDEPAEIQSLRSELRHCAWRGSGRNVETVQLLKLARYRISAGAKGHVMWNLNKD